MSKRYFGSYLRTLRLEHDPPMTQEQLAKKIGRGKMTISQFESGKNTAPGGELLTKIVEALDLTPQQKDNLILLASRERKVVPNDIEKYFFDNPSILKAIRAGKNKAVDDSFWGELSERIEKRDDKKD